MDRDEIIRLLKSRGNAEKDLLDRAKALRDKEVSDKVYLRGLIEFSNICDNDCFYCGIRKSNENVNRYILEKDVVLECVRKSVDLGMRSIVLQSGERKDKDFIIYVEETLKIILKKYPNVRIVLSCGEQTRKTYKRWFDAGARRYLLRIETTNKEHYKKLHPKKMLLEKRKKCLIWLREVGFQVGTGVMIGSPYQRIEDLADDLLFFKELDVDMVGMGPFIEHKETPFGSPKYEEDGKGYIEKLDRLDLSLKMIAILRLMMPKINIASTTALEALNKKGRVLGFNAGANVVMPLMTPSDVKENYNLYDNKTLKNKGFSVSFDSVVDDIKEAGMIPALNEAGDPLHYLERCNRSRSIE